MIAVDVQELARLVDTAVNDPLITVVVPDGHGQQVEFMIGRDRHTVDVRVKVDTGEAVRRENL